LFTKDDNEVIPKSKIVNIGEMPWVYWKNWRKVQR
jgi:hypothetical protein